MLNVIRQDWVNLQVVKLEDLLEQDRILENEELLRHSFFFEKHRLEVQATTFGGEMKSFSKAKEKFNKSHDC